MQLYSRTATPFDDVHKKSGFRQQGCNTDPRRVFRFYCPTPHPQRPKTGWVCIKIDDLCNTIPDCPGAEDEDPTHCMYYVSTQKQMVELRKVLIDILRRPDQLRNSLNMEINNENSMVD
uniref:Uncharacterized protein n=1 Tax=Romanomermis culicivorax TaxID=13658 RepID=A0A915HJJ1_ROMCU